MEKTDDSDELRFMRIAPPFLWKGGQGGDRETTAQAVLLRG